MPLIFNFLEWSDKARQLESEQMNRTRIGLILRNKLQQKQTNQLNFIGLDNYLYLTCIAGVMHYI